MEYIEVRALDVNPFSSTGISADQMRFLDVFLLYCLLQDSPQLDTEQQKLTEQNLRKVVAEGRRNGLELMDGEQPRLMLDWAEQLFAEMMPVARWLDQAYQTEDYQTTLKQQYLCLLDPSKTLSGQILQQLLASGQDNGNLILKLSEQYREQLLKQPYQYYSEADFIAAAADSLQQQADIERSDVLSFEEYLKQYFAEVPVCKG